ncbi:hypothetical protein [Devosia sp. A16]|uniref:hypothetical protein n=1 Tax=Devosia sp. A16 TaxID=1736675 RepID=UPI0006D77895|nr:hypothetical protein [Devosia sp. A16]
MANLPKPGMPLVESPEPGVQRWTFASDDPAEQRKEYRYWLGWFGLEEDVEPFERHGRVWLVRGPTVE